MTFACTTAGPYPATTSPLHTSVGMTAVDRFTRPIAFQDAPPRRSHRSSRRTTRWESTGAVDGVPH